MHRFTEVDVYILEGLICTNVDTLPKGERKLDAEVDKAFIAKRKNGSEKDSFIHNVQCMYD